MLTVGSLFSGIGGLDLGLERAGMTVRWQVEVDPFCQRVLAKHWPHVRRYGDIRELSGEELERVDLICGGFPCQDVSDAGQRVGIDGERSGLWHDMARIVRAVRPRLVLVENTRGLLARGMDRVLGDLARLGFDAEWSLLSAAEMGAPHLRERVFILAYAPGDLRGAPGDARPVAPDWRRALLADADGEQPQRGRVAGVVDSTARAHEAARAERERLWNASGDHCPDVANAEGERRQVRQPERGRQGRPSGSGEAVSDAKGRICGRDERWPESPIRPSGLGGWPTEPAVGRVANGVPDRLDRLRSLGNAVVPQCAQWIGERIVAADRAAHEATVVAEARRDVAERPEFVIDYLLARGRAG